MAQTESKSRWWRDLLIIPLVVGLVIASVEYGLPRIIDRGKELSYSTDGPITYLDIDQQEVGDVTVEVNDVPISRLFVYKVRLRNSGSVPLSNIPVRFAFDTSDAGFQIFSVNHDTEPEFEFGQITEEGSDTASKRFVYELLNPDDEDNITFLTNDSAELAIYAKLEGLTLKHVKPRGWLQSLDILAAIIGMLGSFLGLGLKTIQDRLVVLKRSRSLKESASE